MLPLTHRPAYFESLKHSIAKQSSDLHPGSAHQPPPPQFHLLPHPTLHFRCSVHSMRLAVAAALVAVAASLSDPFPEDDVPDHDSVQAPCFVVKGALESSVDGEYRAVGFRNNRYEWRRDGDIWNPKVFYLEGGWLGAYRLNDGSSNVYRYMKGSSGSAENRDTCPDGVSYHDVEVSTRNCCSQAGGETGGATCPVVRACDVPVPLNCTLHTCSSGFQDKANKAGIVCGGAPAVCSDAACCDASLQCDSFACSDGFQDKANKADIVCGGTPSVCDAQTCCDPATALSDPFPEDDVPDQNSVQAPCFVVEGAFESWINGEYLAVGFKNDRWEWRPNGDLVDLRVFFLDDSLTTYRLDDMSGHMYRYTRGTNGTARNNDTCPDGVSYHDVEVSTRNCCSQAGGETGGATCPVVRACDVPVPLNCTLHTCSSGFQDKANKTGIVCGGTPAVCSEATCCDASLQCDSFACSEGFQAKANKTDIVCGGTPSVCDAQTCCDPATALSDPFPEDDVPDHDSVQAPCFVVEGALESSVDGEYRAVGFRNDRYEWRRDGDIWNPKVFYLEGGWLGAYRLNDGSSNVYRYMKGSSGSAENRDTCPDGVSYHDVEVSTRNCCSQAGGETGGATCPVIRACDERVPLNCTLHTCSSGFQNKANKAGIVCGGAPAVCSDAACCDASLQCDSFACSEGFQAKANKADIVCGGTPSVCDAQTCCDPAASLSDPFPEDDVPDQNSVQAPCFVVEGAVKSRMDGEYLAVGFKNDRWEWRPTDDDLVDLRVFFLDDSLTTYRLDDMSGHVYRYTRGTNGTARNNDTCPDGVSFHDVEVSTRNCCSQAGGETGGATCPVVRACDTPVPLNCTLHTCSSGFQDKANKTGIVCGGTPAVCSDAACCDASLQCDSFACSEGFQDKANKADIVCGGTPSVCDAQTCCDPATALSDPFPEDDVPDQNSVQAPCFVVEGAFESWINGEYLAVGFKNDRWEWRPNGDLVDLRVFFLDDSLTTYRLDDLFGRMYRYTRKTNGTARNNDTCPDGVSFHDVEVSTRNCCSQAAGDYAGPTCPVIRACNATVPLNCTLHTCSSGFQDKANKTGIVCGGAPAVCSDATCCDASLQCDSFACSDGFQDKANKADIMCGGTPSVCDAQTCCDPATALSSDPFPEDDVPDQNSVQAPCFVVEGAVKSRMDGEYLAVGFKNDRWEWRPTDDDRMFTSGRVLFLDDSLTTYRLDDLFGRMYRYTRKTNGTARNNDTCPDGVSFHDVEVSTRNCCSQAAGDYAGPTCPVIRACNATVPLNCTLHSCSSGFQDKANKTSIVCGGTPAVCSDATCCDASLQCDSFACSDGFRDKANKADIVCGGTPSVCDAQTCCDPAASLSDPFPEDDVPDQNSVQAPCFVVEGALESSMDGEYRAVGFRNDRYEWRRDGDIWNPKVFYLEGGWLGMYRLNNGDSKMYRYYESSDTCPDGVSYHDVEVSTRNCCSQDSGENGGATCPVIRACDVPVPLNCTLHTCSSGFQDKANKTGIVCGGAPAVCSDATCCDASLQCDSFACSDGFQDKANKTDIVCGGTPSVCDAQTCCDPAASLSDPFPEDDVPDQNSVQAPCFVVEGALESSMDGEYRAVGFRNDRYEWRRDGDIWNPKVFYLEGGWLGMYRLNNGDSKMYRYYESSDTCPDGVSYHDVEVSTRNCCSQDSGENGGATCPVVRACDVPVPLNCTLHTCSSGFQDKANKTGIVCGGAPAVCSDATCCDASLQCDSFACSDGFQDKANKTDIVCGGTPSVCDAQTCCDPAASLSDPFPEDDVPDQNSVQAPCFVVEGALESSMDGEYRAVGFRNDRYEWRRDGDIWNPKVFYLEGGWLGMYRLNNGDSKMYRYYESSDTCPDGVSYHDVEVSTRNCCSQDSGENGGATCPVIRACNETVPLNCTLHTCSSGFQDKANKTGIVCGGTPAVCSDATCCDASLQCDSFACSDGFQAKANKADIVCGGTPSVCDAQTCCDPATALSSDPFPEDDVPTRNSVQAPCFVVKGALESSMDGEYRAVGFRNDRYEWRRDGDIWNPKVFYLEGGWLGMYRLNNGDSKMYRYYESSDTCPDGVSYHDVEFSTRNCCSQDSGENGGATCPVVRACDVPVPLNCTLHSCSSGFQDKANKTSIVCGGTPAVCDAQTCCDPATSLSDPFPEDDVPDRSSVQAPCFVVEGALDTSMDGEYRAVGFRYNRFEWRRDGEYSSPKVFYLESWLGAYRLDNGGKFMYRYMKGSSGSAENRATCPNGVSFHDVEVSTRNCCSQDSGEIGGATCPVIRACDVPVPLNCTLHTCSSGFQDKANKTGIVCGGAPAVCSDAACCDASLQCDSFACSEEFRDKANKTDIVCGGTPSVCDAQTCCDPATSLSDPFPEDDVPTRNSVQAPCFVVEGALESSMDGEYRAVGFRNNRYEWRRDGDIGNPKVFFVADNFQNYRLNDGESKMYRYMRRSVGAARNSDTCPNGVSYHDVEVSTRNCCSQDSGENGGATCPVIRACNETVPLNCTLHTCSSGFQDKANKTGIVCGGTPAVCSDDTCCDASLQCDSFACSEGFQDKANKADIVCGGTPSVCDRALCCDIVLTCVSHTCGPALQRKTHATGIICPGQPPSCDDAKCCDERRLCGSHTCSSGFQDKRSKSQIVCPGTPPLCNDASCCDLQKLCASYVCSDGVKDITRKAQTLCKGMPPFCDDETCCQVVAIDKPLEEKSGSDLTFLWFALFATGFLSVLCCIAKSMCGKVASKRGADELHSFEVL